MNPLRPLHQMGSSGVTLVQDAGLTHLSQTLGCVLEGSSKELQRSLSKALVTRPSIREERQADLRKLRSASATLAPTWNARFQRIQAITQECASFFQKTREDDSLEQDAISQLLFQQYDLKILNGIPFFLLVMAMFKIWAVPFMTLVFPLIAWISPQIMLKFVQKLPINQGQQAEILKSLWTGAMPTMFQPAQLPPVSSLWSGRSIVQFLFMAVSFAQSMIQPITNAQNLWKIDRTISRLGGAVVEFREIVEGFRQDAESLKLSVAIHPLLRDLDPKDPRNAFFQIQDDPQRLQLQRKELNRLEILWRFSQTPLLRPVRWVESPGPQPYLEIQEVSDLSLGSESVPSSVLFSETHTHAVLTGPNGGGKSSFLRSVLQTVLLSQSQGVAAAQHCQIKPFRWVASGIRLHDTPGELSTFETEVAFAAAALRQSRGPGLLLFDELFHSTNPPDGIRSAERFLKNLWKRGDCASVVSTHVFHLVENAPKGVQRLCSYAEGEGENLKFSQRVEPGVCTLSSVPKVWAKFGLPPS